MPSTRESLTSTSLSRVERGELALGQRPDDAVGPVGHEAVAVGRDDGELVRLAHLADGGDGVVDALEPDVGIALDEDAQGSVDAWLERGGRREDALVDPVAHEVARRARAQAGERVGDPARLGDEA